MGRLTVAVAAAAAAACGPAGRADDDPTHRFPSTAVHTMARAGYPQEVRPHAVPADTGHETGGWVGGGRLPKAARRDPRVGAVDGTWGWDYVGFGRRPGRVFLGWWHGRPGQPLPGPYKADLPELPDPIAAHPIQKFVRGGRAGGEHAGE